MATTALAERARAEVVPYVPPGGPQTVENLNGGFPGVSKFDIDLDGDGQYDFVLDGYLGFVFRTPSFSGENQVLLQPDSIVSYLAAIVAPGETIGPVFVDSYYWSQLGNFIGTRGFFGVRFDIPGGSPHFGYLDIAIDSTQELATLYGGGYESEPNAPITTPVPEPSGLALLALGAAGLAAWRNRKRSSCNG
jgi:hypothetical protein